MSLLSPTEGARREAGRQAQEAKKKGELGATQAKNKVERAIDRVRTDEELREKMIVGLVSSAVTAAIGALSMLAWRRRGECVQ